MADTLEELYLKYVENVGATMEQDRYFQYLFAMAQAGENSFQQNVKVLHKKVDESWLKTIEDCLDSITNIIDNPRRFLATKEEVVPVELAKKITEASVRHLSQNTQFIAPSDDETVHPTRILNVSTEDSYDLYENRFVYYLIQRLMAFIDKRTDLIFWSTGDEMVNVLVMDSKIDDAYETIEYKLEMKIKNRQSFAENDNDNMETFMRIDRVRRRVMAFRKSPFCSLLAGCARVRSPIQRTNLIMKNPDYRNCYKLWLFLESYDSQGYTIEEIDTPLSFDEEYITQLQTGLITNYSVFKSILDRDERDIDKPEEEHRRKIEPKFVKRIQEEIVDDFDIEDVEIRKVFVQEVTQAQIEAEEKLAEQLAATKLAEQERDEVLKELHHAQMAVQVAEERLTIAETDARQAFADRDQAQMSLTRLANDSRNSILAAEQARLAAEKNAEQMELDNVELKALVRNSHEERRKAERERDEARAELETAENHMLSDRINLERAMENENIARRENTELKNNVAGLTERLEELTRQKEKEAERLEKLESKRSLLESKVRDFDDSTARMRKELKLLQEQYKARQSAHQKASAQAQQALREKEAEVKRCSELEEQLSALRKELETEREARQRAETRSRRRSRFYGEGGKQ